MDGRLTPRATLAVLGTLAAALLTGACGRDRPVAWQEGDGYRWRELQVEGEGVGFEAVPPSRSGVEFANRLPEELLMESEPFGSGVALGDVDGDGAVDIFLCRLDGPNALYRNLGGWRFEDVAAEAGVALPDTYSRSAAFADVDGDGDPDLLVGVHAGPNLLLLNDGSGRFRPDPDAGFVASHATTTLTLADVDGDRDLDLYVANYKESWVRDLYPRSEVTFDRVVERRGDEYVVRPEFEDHFRVVEENGVWSRREFAEPDEFYLNDGKGRFERVSMTAGRFLDESGEPLGRVPDDWGLAARFQDLNADGEPDLYVANDLHSPDHIWINQGAGRFRAITTLAVRKTSASSMSVDFSDADLDGDVDVFTSEMRSRDPRRRKTQVPEMRTAPTLAGERLTRPQVNRNALQLNRGDDTYAEIAHYAGLDASGWTWGVQFLDVDLDGREDLLTTTGQRLDWIDADTRERLREAPSRPDWRRRRLAFPVLHERNYAFRNQGALKFRELGETWGFGTEEDISHGLASGDLDGDGDLDVVVNRLDESALLLRNVTAAPRVAVRLRGASPNTAGVGARVTLRGGPVPSQRKEVTAGGLMLSHADPVSAFAAPARDDATLEVRWRSGRRSVVEGVGPNRLYEVFEPVEGATPVQAADPEAPERGDPEAPERGDPEARAQATAADPESASTAVFEDVSRLLDHRHVEQIADEFGRQPLLPLRLTQLGPGVSWIDADGDGDPDLFVGSGRGGRLAYLRNGGDGFRSEPLGLPPTDLDLTTILAAPRAGVGSDLWVGVMNYEAATPDSARAVHSVLRIVPGGGAAPSPIRPVVPGSPAATGPLAAADYDGDGDLDLFVGGRVYPSAYPVPADSRLFRREDGRLVADEVNGEMLRGAGLVSSALFTDVDVDGDPDLVLAVEWGAPKLLLNEDGRFVDATVAWGLAAYPGRWNGVASGDLDEDGRPDLILTGWGENLEHTASSERPLFLYYGDFDRNGVLDLIEARYDERLGGVAPLRSLPFLAGGLPLVRRNAPTHSAYADATVAQLLGDALGAARRLQAVTLSHLLLLNRADRFEATPLPPEAQFAPAFYAGVADFDGDGHDDVFLTQNFFATDLSTPRHDAGRSLWLRGDGTGSLHPVPGGRSGVRVYGDPRGAALGDFDRDGRIDLAVSQNGAETKLYRNRGARPGLRVRLVGPPENPHAVGATVRLSYAGRAGPAREIQAGSGYWSQDDPVQVFGIRGESPTVSVSWPDGTRTTRSVEEGVREITIRWEDPR